MSESRADYHAPVMGKEVLSFLEPSDSGLYFDGTVGGGGHSRMILKACEGCRIIAVDRDEQALNEARSALAPFSGRVRFVHRRFDDAVRDPEVQDRGLNGALLDLGVSSHQLDDESRGFAFRRGVTLDMRMDQTQDVDAIRFLAEADEEVLYEVFRDLGEERNAKRLAREVAKRRSSEAMTTSDQLVAALSVVLQRPPTSQDKARIFQAVRIAVNGELDALQNALPALRDALVDGGVLVVLSYHSLEDRMVKNAFRDWSKSCVCPPELPVCRCRGHALGETLTRKPLKAPDAETIRNPRARSARLRAWRRAA